MIVEDLDVLRPEPKFFRIGNTEIDVSFIPCGITFDIDTIVSELSKFKISDLQEDPEAEKDFTPKQKLEAKENRAKCIKESFKLTIELCVAFCSWKNPDLDYEWFQSNTTAGQVRLLSEGIKVALQSAYNSGVSSSPKKERTVRNNPAKKSR